MMGTERVAHSARPLPRLRGRAREGVVPVRTGGTPTPNPSPQGARKGEGRPPAFAASKVTP